MKSRKKLRITHEQKSNDTRHILAVIALWVGVSVLAVIIALAVGNALGDSVSGIFGGGSIPSSGYKYTGEDVPPIDAWQISLSGQTLESLNKALDSLPRSAEAVSLYLRIGNSAPTYYSAVYATVTGNAISGISLTDAVSLLHKRGFYVSGCFDINSPKLTGNTGGSALSDFETALLSEAAASGIDELILMHLPAGKSGISEAVSIFKKMRAKHPEIILGASIDHSLMLSDAGAEALLSYLDIADFCAIDTAGARAIGSSAVSIIEKLEYVFKTYPVRLLFEFSDINDRIYQSDKLRELGVTNIQSHKQAAISNKPAG